MLEKYCYINNTYCYGDIGKKVQTLFLSNNQPKRYVHVSSVVKRIDMIAIQYGLNRDKCYASAMLHDISTLIKWEDMLHYARENNWILCDAEVSAPFLLHQRISEVIVREDFNIIDDDILKAIAYHTSLCENASQYQMALFIADKLENSINEHPPYYKQMLEALNISLEAACYEYVKYMECDRKMSNIHSDWEKAVDWLKKVVIL